MAITDLDTIHDAVRNARNAELRAAADARVAKDKALRLGLVTEEPIVEDVEPELAESEPVAEPEPEVTPEAEPVIEPEPEVIEEILTIEPVASDLVEVVEVPETSPEPTVTEEEPKPKASKKATTAK